MAGLAVLLLGGKPTVRTPLTGTAEALGVSPVVLRATAALDTAGVVAALDGRAVTGCLCPAPVSAAVAYRLWFRGTGRPIATCVTFPGPLSPPTAAVIGWAAPGESLTPVRLLGMAIAFGATLSGRMRTAKPKTFSSAEWNDRKHSMDLTGGALRG
ncbi:hypothetical protein [Streptomyces enissocaesilis]|uniref:Uncharacterized protein n=1 Tax=Streptomyces enissocaesilis TaxID=332589 RepID=A0ABP6K080_9ACTN